MFVLVSLPMRERGLKPFVGGTGVMGEKSLPMRERGLKHITTVQHIDRLRVAPHAGAWIETGAAAPANAIAGVAPHAGAWIETNGVLKYRREAESRSPCGSVD